LRGRPIDFTLSTVAATRSWSHPESSIDRPLAARLAFRGEIDEARSLLRQLRGAADENGDVQSSRLVQQMLCETELRAGNTRDAGRLVDELDDEVPWMSVVHARLRTLLAAVIGDPLGTAKSAATVLEPGSGDVQGWDRLEATRAVGLAALFEQDTARAVENLRAVWEHTLREHVDDPGAFPVGADLVEALVLSGDTRSAKDVTERLQRSAAKQGHPWALASAKRSVAAVRLADSYVDEAAKALDEAALDYGRLGLYFDRARTLLFLGVVQRRYLKRAAARESLEEAATQFELCGSSGWAARGRSELARVSGRRSEPDEKLTPSERRVVDLAVRGLSNKEIAGRLVVSVNTVEAHLSHAFAKLGVRSRTQLARLFSTGAE
jgi:DNA-binding CsgD family transcriptional regulator